MVKGDWLIGMLNFGFFFFFWFWFGFGICIEECVWFLFLFFWFFLVIFFGCFLVVVFYVCVFWWCKIDLKFRLILGVGNNNGDVVDLGDKDEVEGVCFIVDKNFLVLFIWFFVICEFEICEVDIFWYFFFV